MVWRFLGRLLLLMLALACAGLSLGAFASLNYGAPQWMRGFLSLPEGLLGAALSVQVPAFVRALLEALLSAWLVYLAAYWPRPKQHKTPAATLGN